jgi:hypothetical protein
VHTRDLVGTSGRATRRLAGSVIRRPRAGRFREGRFSEPRCSLGQHGGLGSARPSCAGTPSQRRSSTVRRYATVDELTWKALCPAVVKRPLAPLVALNIEAGPRTTTHERIMPSALRFRASDLSLAMPVVVILCAVAGLRRGRTACPRG